MVRKRRALITGLDGFTGRYVDEAMSAAGWEVFGTGMAYLANKPRYRQIDLADGAGMRAWIAEVAPDAVIHLAGIAFVAHGNADAIYEVNLLGTRHLLTVLAELPTRPGCVLLASSANVYGNSVGGMLDEQQLPNPANDYAVSKLAMEHMARLWLDRLPIVIARPFNYTGVGQSEAFLVPKIVAHFRARAASIELGNLDVSRDFSDVRTVADAYRRLAEACPVGETVNICSGHSHSLREVLALAEEISGWSMPVRVNPAFVRNNEVKSLCGNRAKLDALIRCQQGFSLEDTLRWMLTTDEPL